MGHISGGIHCVWRTIVGACVFACLCMLHTSVCFCMLHISVCVCVLQRKPLIQQTKCPQCHGDVHGPWQKGEMRRWGDKEIMWGDDEMRRTWGVRGGMKHLLRFTSSPYNLSHFQDFHFLVEKQMVRWWWVSFQDTKYTFHYHISPNISLLVFIFSDKTSEQKDFPHITVTCWM